MLEERYNLGSDSESDDEGTSQGITVSTSPSKSKNNGLIHVDEIQKVCVFCNSSFISLCFAVLTFVPKSQICSLLQLY